MSFASKTDQKEAFYLCKAFLSRRRPVANSIQPSLYRNRSYAKNHGEGGEGEVDHSKTQTLPTISHNVLIDIRPQTHQESGLQLRNQESALTSPPITQCFRSEETWRCSYSQTEFPIINQPPIRCSGNVNSCTEPDSYSDFNTFLTPPLLDLEALCKTWEQVRIHRMNMSIVSTQTRSSISYRD